jgi:hypothetical protein
MTIFADMEEIQPAEFVTVYE